jgi:ankyrin repeat protein
MLFKQVLFLALAGLMGACGPLAHEDQSSQSQAATALPTSKDLPARDLITAAKNSDLASVRQLLSKGSNPNVLNSSGLGPLHYAAVLGNIEITQLLVNARAYLNAPANTNYPAVLHMAAQGGNAQIVQYLLSKGASLNTAWLLNGHTALLEATFNARIDVVAVLLKAGADTEAVTLRGLTASDLAAREADRNPDMKTILGMLNARNKQLGLSADANGKVDFSPQQKSTRLEALLNVIDPPRYLNAIEIRKADLQKRLQDASEKGDLDAVKRIVEVEKADLNTLAGRLGTTPLILASVAGKEDVVSYLLTKGANPNLHELHPMGISALFKAAVFGHTETAHKLLQAGAQANEQGAANGMSPLHDAVFRGRVDVAKLLLSFGADPRLKDYTGRTPKDLAKGRPALEALFN